jgi:uncharacterized protein (DUF1501 family)
MQLAKVMKLRTQLQLERSVFVTEVGGFDTHQTFNLSPMLGGVDAALGSMVTELKAQVEFFVF